MHAYECELHRYKGLICVHSYVTLYTMQDGDYRIIMINTFEVHAYHIICEVSMHILYTVNLGSVTHVSLL